MRNILVFAFSILFIGTISLFGQSAIEATPGFIHSNIPGSGLHNFLYPDDIMNRYPSVETGIKKSLNADFGDTPDWIWAKQFGGSAPDAGTAVTSDAMGNIYVAGYFSGTLIVGNDTLESTGANDMVIMMLSQTCYPLWIKQVSASADKSIIPESICLDNSGNFVVSGYFNGQTIEIGGTFLTRTGNQDIFTVKFNSSGGLIWAKNYGEPGRTFSGSKIKCDASDNSYIICSEGTYNSANMYTTMMKYNSSGQLIFNHTKENCIYQDIEININNIYLSGGIKNYAEFGDSVLNPGSFTIFLAKSDLAGNFVWAISPKYTVTAWRWDEMSDIASGNDGNIYITGFSSSGTIWGNDTVKENCFMPFISKISPAGQIFWTKSPEETSYYHFNHLYLDTQNNIYITGDSYDTINYDGVVIFPPYYVLKCNSDGEGLWAKKLDFAPKSVNRSASDEMIATGSDLYFNMCVIRYSPNIIPEFTLNIKSKSGYASVWGLETGIDASLYTYGSLSGSGEIFGIDYNNFKGAFLSRQNGRGDLSWIKFIEGASPSTYPGNSLILNRKHNCLYLIGSITDTMEIGTETLSPSDGKQYLAKYNINGDFEWIHPIMSLSNLEGTSISTDNQGNVIISGFFIHNVTVGDSSLITNNSGYCGYIAKFDVDGGFKWAIKITNNIYESGIGMTSTDKDNMIYYTGAFFPGDINFNGTIINTSGSTEGNILFAKLDQNGIPLWIKTFGNGKERSTAYPVNLVTDPGGYTYIYGRYRDTIYFDNFLLPKPFPGYSKYNYNYFISKIDPSGNAVWANPIYSSGPWYRNEINADSAGNCYIMTTFRDTLILGDDLVLPNSETSDIMVAKYYSKGDLAWVKSLGTTYYGNSINGIAVFDTLSLFIGGSFSNEASFGPVTLKTTGQQGFIALLSQEKLNCMEITSSSSDYVCAGKNDGYIDIAVTGGTPPYTYKWSNGEITEDIEGLTAGEYSVTITDDRLCIMKKTLLLDSLLTYQGSELCMVTVNNNNKIILVWEKEYGKYIAAYRLYREKSLNNYIKIAEVPFENLSVYADQGSTPSEYSHFYKIKAVDVCGDSSEFSPYHKSIHLWTAVGVSGEVTLTWDEYQGFIYSEYIIYRGNSLDAMQQIRTIPSSSKSWTDPDPPVGQVYYRVQVFKPEACFPTSNKAEEYGSTVSNYDEETIGMIAPPPDQQITIFPNPFKERTRIGFPNPGNTSWQLIITDLSGKVVRTENNITSGEFEVERGNLPAGTYLEIGRAHV
jgi:hypothetical protein